MKQKLIGLSQRYATALPPKPGPRSNLQPAWRLGRQAVGLGLETLELARSHATIGGKVGRVLPGKSTTIQAEIPLANGSVRGGRKTL